MLKDIGRHERKEDKDDIGVTRVKKGIQLEGDLNSPLRKGLVKYALEQGLGKQKKQGCGQGGGECPQRVQAICCTSAAVMPA